MACRLALAKAQSVAALHPQAVVIGSDQVADLDGQALGKPGNHARAVAQLQTMRGKTAIFQTAVAVVCQASGFAQTELAQVKVKFRDLSDAQIEAYLLAETPYDCAGSAKSEGLGIALLERIDNDDPTALIGLPLIRHTLRCIQATTARPASPAPKYLRQPPASEFPGHHRPSNRNRPTVQAWHGQGWQNQATGIAKLSPSVSDTRSSSSAQMNARVRGAPPKSHRIHALHAPNYHGLATIQNYET